MKLQHSIHGVVARELRALARQLEAYEDEADIWRVPAGIGNSAGTLTLHLAGNLQSFLGAVLGDSGYVRDRQAEFSRRDVPRTELLLDIERTAAIVDKTLTELADEQLTEPFPLSFEESQVNTADFLVHLATHLSFHIGQIDYHRRLVTGDNRSIGPLAVTELASAATNE